MKFSTLLFLVFFCFGPSLSSYGQTQSTDSLSTSSGYINISSNYGQVYVIIDRDFDSLKMVNADSLVELEPGYRSITIVPEFSPSFTLNRYIVQDSIYSFKLSFSKILDERPDLYKDIALRGSSIQEYNWEDIKYERLNGSYSISSTSLEKYQELNTTNDNTSNTFLKVKSNLDSLYVGLNSDVFKIASGDSIPIKPGDRFVKLSHQYSNEWNTRVWLDKGKTTTLNKNFDLEEPSVELLRNNISTNPHYNANLIVVTDEDSRVTIDGQVMGYGAAKTTRRTGPVSIEIFNNNTGTVKHFPKIKNQSLAKAIVIDGYTKPKYSKVRFYSLVPGFAQYYKWQNKKALIISGSFLLASGLSIYSNSVYNKELSEFRDLRIEYLNATTEEEALQLGNALDNKHDEVVKRDNQRIISFSITSLIYAFNIYDALFNKPKSGYWKKTNIDFYLGNQNIDGTSVSALSIKYAF